MSDTLRTWISEELERRKWSQGELARQAGITRSFVTRVLLDDASPSVNFVTKVAGAFNVAPEKLLRLAGILPPSPAPDDDNALQELMDIARNLPKGQREQLLEFAKFLYERGKEE